MSLVTDWIQYILAQDAAGTLGPVPSSSVLSDAPDANCAVLPVGIKPTRPESTQRVQIDEVVRGCPDSQGKTLALANLVNANGAYMFMGTKTMASKSAIGPNGNVDPKSPNIPNTIVAAAHDNRTGADVWRTLQAYIDGINALEDFTTNDGSGF